MLLQQEKKGFKMFNRKQNKNFFKGSSNLLIMVTTMFFSTVFGNAVDVNDSIKIRVKSLDMIKELNVIQEKTKSKKTQNITSSKKLGMIVPLYIYPDFNKPNSEWQRIIDNKKAHPKADIIVIVNPSNGHFSKTDPTYVNAIKKIVKANITVVGYVYTRYGVRDIKFVKNDINSWTRLYKKLGVTGIFFDEVEGRDSKGERAYYEKLTKYIKAKGYETSILNPGITADQTFIDNYTADIIVSFEASYTAYKRDFKTGDVGKTIESKKTSTALMVYDIDSVSNLKKAIADAPSDGFDYIYVTSSNKNWSNLGKNFETHITEMLKYNRDPRPYLCSKF